VWGFLVLARTPPFALLFALLPRNSSHDVKEEKKISVPTRIEDVVICVSQPLYYHVQGVPTHILHFHLKYIEVMVRQIQSHVQLPEAVYTHGVTRNKSDRMHFDLLLLKCEKYYHK